MLVGDAAVVRPERVGENLLVRQVGEAHHLAGLDHRIGIDGVGAVGRDLTDDGTGLAVVELVQAGRDAAVERRAAAAELDAHRAEEIRPIEGPRRDARTGVPVGPAAAGFHVMIHGPAAAEVVFPFDAAVTLAGADRVGGIEGGEGSVGLARVLEFGLRKQVGAVAAEARVLLRVLRIAGEQVLVPMVPVVEVLAVDLHRAAAVVLVEVTAEVEPVVHRVAVGRAVALGVAVEAAHAVIPPFATERAADHALDAEMRSAPALKAVAGTQLAAKRRGTDAADVIEGAAGGIGGSDRGAAPADRLDPLQRAIGAVEVARVVVAEIDVRQRQAVLLH